MKDSGRRSKNVSKDTPKTRGQLMLRQQEQNRRLEKYQESERAIPKKVDTDMERAARTDRFSKRTRRAVVKEYQVDSNRRLRATKVGADKR